MFRRRRTERSFADVFLAHRGKNTLKWEHYFEAYHRHFSPWIDRQPTVLEIGVMQGGSLQILKSYFGRGARIVGIDINPRAVDHAEEGIDVHVGSQADPAFLEGLARRYGGFDVIIDDGSHRSGDQKAALEALWPWLHEPGVYLCEDVHTSYFTRFGGGYRRSGTFIERMKELVDALHVRWCGRLPEEEVKRWTPLHSLHFYPGMVFLEKRPHDRVRLIRITSGEVQREPVREPRWGETGDRTG